jgi:hypothetical protein
VPGSSELSVQQSLRIVGGWLQVSSGDGGEGEQSEAVAEDYLVTWFPHPALALRLQHHLLSQPKTADGRPAVLPQVPQGVP